MDKINMEYQVVDGYKPGTTEIVRHPVITNRETIKGVSLVERALESGNCRGQLQDILGQLNGFTEAMRALLEKGKAVTMSSWIRIAPQLVGSVGEERKLTKANTLKVSATALTDMKKSIGEFSWTNVNDSGVKVKIASILYVGGTPGFVKKGVAANITGRNLQFSAALGDTLRIAATGLAEPVSITPTESDYAHIKFALPAAVAALPDDTVLTITLVSRGGVAGAADQTNVKEVTMLKSDTPPPVITSVTADSTSTAISVDGTNLLKSDGSQITSGVIVKYNGTAQTVNDVLGNPSGTNVYITMATAPTAGCSLYVELPTSPVVSKTVTVA